jgi:hypothetical protein
MFRFKEFEKSVKWKQSQEPVVGVTKNMYKIYRRIALGNLPYIRPKRKWLKYCKYKSN